MTFSRWVELSMLTTFELHLFSISFKKPYGAESCEKLCGGYKDDGDMISVLKKFTW